MTKRLLNSILIVLFFLNGLNAQERTITGKVTDLMDNPVAGVTVSIKDYASLMTISGADGEYRIDVFDFSKTLVFTFASMKTKEMPIGNNDTISVKMEYLPMKNPNPWSIGFFIRPVNTEIYNETIANNEDWDLESEFGIGTEISIDYFLTQNIGIGTGIGYSEYNTGFYLSNFDNYGENYLDRVDKDGDLYYLYNIVNEVNETNKIQSIDIPIKLKFRYRQNKTLGLYLDLGAKFMYIFQAKIQGDILAEWQGYYPDYHVVLHDLPEYDFILYNTDIGQSWKDYEQLNISLMGSLGISLRFSKKFHADLGFYFDYGLTDLKYEQAKHPADFINTIGITDKTITKAVGLNMGIRYDLSKKR